MLVDAIVHATSSYHADRGSSSTSQDPPSITEVYLLCCDARCSEACVRVAIIGDSGRGVSRRLKAGRMG
jgi:hypothetical protein